MRKPEIDPTITNDWQFLLYAELIMRGLYLKWYALKKHERNLYFPLRIVWVKVADLLLIDFNISLYIHIF